MFGALLVAALAVRAHAATPIQPESLCSNDDDGAHLQLIADNIRSSRGTIIVVVYGDRQEDFLVKGKRIVKVRVPAKSGTIKVCIKLPRPGTYAVAAYHDEDNDNHLTRNVVGLPQEGHAFSNNPTPIFGMPSHREVSFLAKFGTTIQTIHFSYP